jgi:modulator of FtsH protease HflC
MRNIAVVGLVVIIFIVLLLSFISFQVSETECALVMTFGEPKREITEPGWNWRWPMPIQTVVKYDARPRVYEGVIEETTTKGGEPIIVSTYIIWKVDQPKKFREAVGDEAGAQKVLKGRLKDTQNKVIGQHYFDDFVNTDPGKIRFGEIENQMLDSLASPVKEAYGLEITAVGIKQLKISGKVTEDVFARMSADRTRKTELTIAQGKTEAMKIRTDAEAKRTELLASADAQAKAIRGEGDAEAAQYYKLLEEDPEFAMFLREIEALKRILKKRATVVLPADVEPFRLLREMPDIKPKK